MNTTIYLIRHSEPTKIVESLITSDNLQVRNEKNILSSNGETRAKKLSLNAEMQNIDVVISSQYVRAMATAKYIAENNGVNITVIENFGERKFGVNTWDELPKDFGKKQFEDPNFKMKCGESREEVTDRMYHALMEVLNQWKGKRVVIASHATALTFLFMKLGSYKNNKIYFKDQMFMDETFKWGAPEVFKLSFIGDELTDMDNIKIDF